MPESCKAHYRELLSNSTTVLEASFQEERSELQSTSHQFINDFKSWVDVLEGRTESQLYKAALKEYQYGLFAVAQGLYRQAFAALRLFLELSLAGVLFSSNEMKMRLWLRGEKDIIWRQLVDDNKGVFSHNFLRAFNVDLKDDAELYGRMAKELYRECSEYVHGGAVTHERLPSSIEFSEEIFSEWHERAENAFHAITFAFCVRYVNDLDNTQLIELEDAVLDFLEHVEPVRIIFQVAS